MTSMALPAWVMLIYWMVLQVVGGLGSIGADGGGVAFWAHGGGFLAGVILVKLFTNRRHLDQHRKQHWQPQRVGWD
jgi:membrane associated rhomboid family serine protease